MSKVKNCLGKGSEKMDMDGFGILMFLSISAGVILGLIKSYSQRNQQPKPIEDNEENLTIEDSEGDGLFLDDPLFPPEFDDIED